MANFLILHGTAATPESNWFMWLKGALIGQGHKVWLPHLPAADNPNEKAYTKFLLSNNKFTIDDQTIIIGHSSGSVEALYLLQHLPTDVVIKAAVLVSSFKDDLGWDSLKGLFNEPFDFDSIKSHCKEFIYVHSDDDPYVPVSHAEFLATQTGGKLMEFEGEGHFNTEQNPDYKQFPELLDIIQDVL
ncbi:MAG: alpha/beta hydrolase [Candidatus Saccharimonadales bacterium]